MSETHTPTSTHVRTRFAIAALVASLAGGAFAQTPPPAPAASAAVRAAEGGHRHGAMNPAQRQQRMEQRMADLRQKLQLTPAQEGAWNSFTQAMRPSATPPQHPDREAMARLTTPERIDQVRAMRATHQAEMDRRADATKAFYATLSPEQKKTFDAQTLRGMGGHGPHEGGAGHGGMHRHHN